MAKIIFTQVLCVWVFSSSLQHLQCKFWHLNFFLHGINAWGFFLSIFSVRNWENTDIVVVFFFWYTLSSLLFNTVLFCTQSRHLLHQSKAVWKAQCLKKHVFLHSSTGSSSRGLAAAAVPWESCESEGTAAAGTAVAACCCCCCCQLSSSLAVAWPQAEAGRCR